MKIKFKNEYDFGERIKERREALNLTRNAVCEALGGISLTTLTLWEKNEREPSASTILKLAGILDTSPKYLLTGDEDESPIHITEAVAVDDEDYELIDDFRDVLVSAGFGAENGDYVEQAKVRVERAWLLGRGLKARDCAMFKVKGDSMCPTLNNGEDIVVDRSKRQLSDGEIFVINHNGVMLVKKVQVLFDGVKLISDNAEYEPFLLDKQDADGLLVIGQVVRVYKDL